VYVGIVQAGDCGLAFQVGNKGKRADMGLDPIVITHVNETTILHPDGRSGTECFIDGIDVSVDEDSVGLLSAANPWGYEYKSV
jgi:hypothetical protein